jgi:uncharacterized membrane protein YcaP (DUF421 family)
MNYLTMVFELCIGFILLFTVMKILGKKQISQITPFDFISALVLGELLGNAIFDQNTGLVAIIIALAVWAVLIYIVDIIERKTLRIRGLMEGKPSLVVNKGKIDREALEKNKLNITQLQSMLRQKEVFSLRQVEYAILETNGTISILKKSPYDTPTLDDLNIPPSTVELPITMILDGQVLWKNIKSCGFNEQWMKNQLNSQGYDDPGDILFADWQQDEGLHVQPFTSDN